MLDRSFIKSLHCYSFSVPVVYDDGYDMAWLYNFVADTWVQGGIPVETQDTIRTGGYYTFSPFPGFRIVSINMNFCNKWNW